MGIFPLQFFTDENAIVGFDQDYKSSPLGKKYAGQPKGVYVGLTPSTNNSELTLSTDNTLGYSLIKVPSNDDTSGIDIIITSSISLDFAGQPSGDFPIHVIARAIYTNDPSVTTSAEIITRSATTVSFDEVLIAEISGPDTSISVSADPDLGTRDEPLALSGIDFGFMPSGSVEDLRTAVDIVNEVIAARVGLDGSQHTSLSDRLVEEFSADSMGGRLSLLFRALRSNDYSISAGSSNVIVSGSFSEINRDFEPEITLNADGDETTEGAIAEPNDTIRNVAVVVDSTSGYRPVDDPTDRRLVFARIEGPNETEVGGTWTFTNASTDVSGSDGKATTEISVGDTLLGADGKYYEISNIVDDNTLELRDAYQGPTAAGSELSIRRWQLRLKKLVGGAEVDASLPTPTTIHFFFGTFLRMNRSHADWKTIMHSSAETEPLPEATTSVPGRVRLADTSVKLGAVKIQNAGLALSGGPFHTLNFNASNASIISTAPGEVEIAEIGPQGPTGPPGASGGPGPPGSPGPGYSEINPFEVSTEFAGAPGGSTPFTFTRDMGHNIRYLAGGIAQWRDAAQFINDGGDRVDISDITTISSTEGRIEGNVDNDTFVTLFLSSAGD